MDSDWERCLDPSSGAYYYFNRVTGESEWELTPQPGAASADELWPPAGSGAKSPAELADEALAASAAPFTRGDERGHERARVAPPATRVPASAADDDERFAQPSARRRPAPAAVEPDDDDDEADTTVLLETPRAAKRVRETVDATEGASARRAIASPPALTRARARARALPQARTAATRAPSSSTRAAWRRRARRSRASCAARSRASRA